MLLKKIHHLKKKIKSYSNNIDLLDIVIEDNNLIRKEISEIQEKLSKKDEEILLLNEKISILENLNVSYSKDILLLAQAIAEQYEVLSSIVNKEYFLELDDILESEFLHNKKKKKIVH